MRHSRSHHGRLTSGAVMIGILWFMTLTGIHRTEVRSQGYDINTSHCAHVRTAEGPSQSGARQPHLPEPDDTLLVREDVNIITGLYTRAYSLRQNGIVDYKTARQIVISEYNEYWNSVVYTKEFPLLYWEDADHDGQFDMWVDTYGEGAPCDIVPYQLSGSDPAR